MLSDLKAMISHIMEDQPRGIGVILFAEFWERFSFYGLMSLFMLYLTKQLHFEDKFAYDVLSVLFALTYILPILGGLAANHFLGYQRAIVTGGLVMALGLGILTFSIVHQPLLYIGLSLVVLGNGLFQPSITSLLGSIYKLNDPHREGGFTYYQICLNGGAVLAPLIYGSIATLFGAEYGFAAVAMGMLIGVLIFIKLRHRLGKTGKLSVANRPQWWFWLSKYAVLTTIVAVIAAVIPLSKLFLHRDIVQVALFIIAAIVIITVIWLAKKRWHTDGKQIFAVIPIALLFILFEALIRLQEGMLTLFTDSYTSRSIGNFTVPTQWFLSLEPLFVILFGAIFANFWLRLNKRYSGPTSSIKFTIAFIFMAAAFGLLLFGVHINSETGRMNSLWLVLSYLFQAGSELSFIPIAIALLTRLAPKDLLGFMVGCLYFSIGFGSYVSAIIAKFTTAPPTKDLLITIQNFLVYGDVFKELAISSIIVVFVLLVGHRYLKRLFNE